MPRHVLIPVLFSLVFATPSSAQQEIENVSAFARMYGVARWFYPSDAAATLDWNRFAVEGVRRVRGASTPAELERALEGLFLPLGTGIEIGLTLSAKRPTGPRDASLVAWHYRGAGFSETATAPYSAKRMNRVSPVRQSAGTASTMSQWLLADTLRGRTIRMRGQVRVDGANASGWAGLWLRVDRSGGSPGFFDNMQNRPVRDTLWREYVIEGPIAADAERIAFGVLSVGGVAVDIDAIDVAVRGSDGAWTSLTVPDPSFETAATPGTRGWAQSGPAAFTRPATGAAHGTRFARIAPGTPGTFPPAVPADSLETPITGAAVDLDLTRGLKARVALSLTDAEASAPSTEFPGLRAAIANVPAPSGRDDADVRVADVVVAWSAFRHFYPYWGDIDVDWDARLRPQLEIALEAATTREAHLDVIRRLVADLRDGHGAVRDLSTTPQWYLPLQLRILDGRLVVTASNDTIAPVGSVITAIRGVPASTRIARETRLASGTQQWRESRAANALLACTPESTVAVSLEIPDGSMRYAQLPCPRAPARASESRPDSITELQPGIWYVDLTRIRTAQLRPMFDTLSKARGVVFDLRGYPTDAGAAILPHLMRTREDSSDRWMHVPRFARPFGEAAAWQSMSWNLQPATPHIGGQRVFLTDGRAISYAESVMGYVRDYKLGTIVGGTTAGANGNVAGFTVPGGFSIVFTGMRVTRHDGRSPYHTVGVRPEIPLEPTLEGIRAGRDELLQRALATFRIVQ